VLRPRCVSRAYALRKRPYALHAYMTYAPIMFIVSGLADACRSGAPSAVQHAWRNAATVRQLIECMFGADAWCFLPLPSDTPEKGNSP
jgi:hypothetical protein